MPLGKEHLLSCAVSLPLCIAGLLEKPHARGAETACTEFLTPSSPLHNVVTVASAPQPPGLFSRGSIKFV